jgi:hypothetical protein
MLLLACRSYTIRVDYAFSSPNSCRTFWLDSRPSQSTAPSTAYRWAFRSVMSTTIAKQKVSGNVRAVTIRCSEPAPKYKSQTRRITMTAKLSPISFTNLTSVVDGYLSQEASGLFTTLVLAKGGPGFAYTPLYFNYVNPNVFPICTLGFGGCSNFPWNPQAIVFVS